MSYAALKVELDTDPLGRGYSGMTDQQIADNMNAVDRTRNRTQMTGKEVKDRIVVSEWDSRTDAQKQIVLAMCNRDDLDPFGIDAQIFQDAMAGATNTINALIAYRVEDISRAEEIFGAPVDVAAIESARLIV